MKRQTCGAVEVDPLTRYRDVKENTLKGVVLMAYKGTEQETPTTLRNDPRSMKSKGEKTF